MYPNSGRSDAAEVSEVLRECFQPKAELPGVQSQEDQGISERQLTSKFDDFSIL